MKRSCMWIGMMKVFTICKVLACMWLSSITSQIKQQFDLLRWCRQNFHLSKIKQKCTWHSLNGPTLSHFSISTTLGSWEPRCSSLLSMRCRKTCDRRVVNASSGVELTLTQGDARVGGSSMLKFCSAMRSGSHRIGKLYRAAARSTMSRSCNQISKYLVWLVIKYRRLKLWNWILAHQYSQRFNRSKRGC